MKLLFNSTTRRMTGTITGDTRGMPDDVILVYAPLPEDQVTAWLDTDNVTILDKPLTPEEIAARSLPGDPFTPTPPKPTVYDEIGFFLLFTSPERFTWRKALNAALAEAEPSPLQIELVSMETLTQKIQSFNMASSLVYGGFPILVMLNIITIERMREILTISNVSEDVILALEGMVG